MHEPCWTPEDSEIAAVTAAAYARQYGRPPVIAGMAAATDASHLIHTGHIPTVIIGPGDFELAHTNRERVECAQVMEAAELYQRIAMEILK